MSGLTLADFPPPSEIITAEPHWIAVEPAQCSASEERETDAFSALWDRLAAIDPEGLEWDVVIFPHWSLSWTQHIFVRPESSCHVATQAL